LGHDENGGASGVLHGVQKNLHSMGRSVLQAMVPLPAVFSPAELLENAKQPGDSSEGGRSLMLICRNLPVHTVCGGLHR